jgi:ADP-ribose pyrophosphatase
MATGERPTVISEGKHLRFLKQDGWEFVTRKGVGGVVALVAVTDDGKLLLVEQFRKPVDAMVIELPAGLAGDGQYRNETLESAARRELREETGYEASQMEYLGGGPASAGLTDELITLFRATGLNKVGMPTPDGDENIIVHEIPLNEVPSWLTAQAERGALADLKIFSALHFAANPNPR